MLSQYEIELELTPDEAIEALSDGAEAWNGTWNRQGTGGQLTLPVAAGVRTGILHGSVSVRSSAGGVHVVFHVERSDYSTNAAAVPHPGPGRPGRPGDARLALAPRDIAELGRQWVHPDTARLARRRFTASSQECRRFSRQPGATPGRAGLEPPGTTMWPWSDPRYCRLCHGRLLLLDDRRPRRRAAEHIERLRATA